MKYVLSVLTMGLLLTANAADKPKYDKLDDIKELLDSGVLTKEEFDIEKKKILSGAEYKKPSQPKTVNETSMATSGVEIRGNIIKGQGNVEGSVTANHPSVGDYYYFSKDSDFDNLGFSGVIGYSTLSADKSKSGFLYVGYEKSQWTYYNDDEAEYSTFLLGAEGGIGSENIKFIYGGEFGYGELDTKVEPLGVLSSWTAEPFIGLRVTPAEQLSITLRVGYRAYFVDDYTQNPGNDVTVTTTMSPYSTNAQIGIGYSFY